MGWRLQSFRSLPLAAASERGHLDPGFGISWVVGVLLPLRPSLLVSGVNSPFEANAPFHVFLACRATRVQIPSGGTVPGSILKGVTVGSCRHIMYVSQRWSSIALVQTVSLRVLRRLAGRSVLYACKGEEGGNWLGLGSGKTNGSELSLSGLVQLPPYESMLPREETEESEMPEHAEEGRLMLSAWLSISASRQNCPAPFRSIPIWPTGVLGGENRRNAVGVGAR